MADSVKSRGESRIPDQLGIFQMAVSRADKEAERQQLEVAFKGAEHIILLDYKGLTVSQAGELRRQVRAARARYRVVKNTLAKQALAGTVVEPLSEFFQGTTAVAYSGDDPVALAKALTSFAKTAPVLTVKAAVVYGQVLTAAAVTELARLPSTPELYAMLLRQLQAAMVQVVSVLSAVQRDLVNVLAQAENKKRTEDEGPKTEG